MNQLCPPGCDLLRRRRGQRPLVFPPTNHSPLHTLFIHYSFIFEHHHLHQGVTYCGDSGSSGLSISNSPFHADVVAFGQAICEARGGEYGLAAEHAHSCCLLLARRDRFFVDGRWHTWIDYDRCAPCTVSVDAQCYITGVVSMSARIQTGCISVFIKPPLIACRFHELVASGQPFTSADYMLPTPEWAEYGNPAAGFSPADERFKKERRHHKSEAASEASAGGCT